MEPLTHRGKYLLWNGPLYHSWEVTQWCQHNVVLCYRMAPFIIHGKLPDDANTLWYLTNNSRICYFPLPFLKHAIKIPWHLSMKCLSYHRYSSSLFMWLMTCHSKMPISLHHTRWQIWLHSRWSTYLNLIPDYIHKKRSDIKLFIHF